MRGFPHVEKALWDVSEVAFGAKRALRQLALMGCLQCWIVGVQVFRRWRRKSQFAEGSELAGAGSYFEWTEIAGEMDMADGGMAWRDVGGPGEKLVDARSLRAATRRLTNLADPAKDDGIHAAMYACRGGALLSREALGLAEPKLYERARTGGPKVVEEYLDAATRCLELIERGFDPSVPTEARLAFFNECRHAHGRTALLLSGGAGLGAYHLGVVKALRDARLLPRVISGASAGSIVAATVCCRDDIELGDILDHMCAGGSFGDDDDDPADEYHLPPADRVKGDPIFRLDFFRWRSSNNLFRARSSPPEKRKKRRRRKKKHQGGGLSPVAGPGASPPVLAMEPLQPPMVDTSTKVRKSPSALSRKISPSSSAARKTLLSTNNSMSSSSISSNSSENIFSKSLSKQRSRRLAEEEDDDDDFDDDEDEDEDVDHLLTEDDDGETTPSLAIVEEERSCPTSPPRENLLTDPSKAHHEDPTTSVPRRRKRYQKNRRSRKRDDAELFLEDTTSVHDEEVAAASTLMCGDHLARVIRTNLGGDLTFQEAFDKTGKILNIPVREHDATGDARRVKAAVPPRLLNYLSSPHVVVWSAVRASCALPGAFTASPLLVRGRDGGLRYEDDDDDDYSGTSPQNAKVPQLQQQQQKKKKPRTVYVDGSMGADLPFETMRTLFNCNHFVCSQTNVHAACFGDSALRLISAVAPGVRAPGLALTSSLHLFDVTHAILNFVKAQLRTWIQHGTTLFDALSAATPFLAPGGDKIYSAGRLPQLWDALVPWQLGAWAVAVMTQPYEGRAQDVTIVPFAGHLTAIQSFFITIKNPEKGTAIADVIAAAQKNTWRELAKIRDHTAVEFALERAVHRLRKDLFHQRSFGSGSKRDADPIGRTPSFYTSSSILQLSGLAVVDPLVNIRPPSHNFDNFVVVPPENHDKPRAASANEIANNGNRIDDVHDDDDDKDDVVCKTSSMANFYYRKPPSRRHSSAAASVRSRSDDKLAYRGQQLHSPVLERNSSTISDGGGPEFF